MKLEGKVALVTGASRGIGRAIATEFAKEGADIVVNYSSSRSRAEAVAKGIEKTGRRVFCARADVSEEKQVQKMLLEIQKNFGRLDILVNNAGIYLRNELDRISGTEWERTIGTDLKGPFLVSREALPLLKKSRGCIINISSVVALSGSRHGAHYAASKAGVLGLTRALAKELSAFGIRANAISPGPVETDMIGKWDKEKKKKIREKIPLGRLATPGDIAKLAVFLASEDSEFITGQNIVVDGGMGLYG